MKYFKNITIVCLILFMLSVGNVFADPKAKSDASAFGNAEIEQNYEASDRPFPNQGGVGYGPLPGFFGDNNRPGHQFISLVKLLMYNTTWNIKDNYDFAPGMKFNYTPHSEPVPDDERSKTVTCTKDMFDKTKVDVTLLGVGAVNSTNKNTISSDLLDKVLYQASVYGATHIQFLAEGTNTELQSSGWGIGLAYTKASDTSISSGGTGYSQGSAGYQNLPWQQFFFLKVVDPAAVADIKTDAGTEEAVDSDLVDENVEKAVQDSTIN